MREVQGLKPDAGPTDYPSKELPDPPVLCLLASQNLSLLLPRGALGTGWGVVSGGGPGGKFDEGSCRVASAARAPARVRADWTTRGRPCLPAPRIPPPPKCAPSASAALAVLERGKEQWGN